MGLPSSRLGCSAGSGLGVLLMLDFVRVGSAVRTKGLGF